MSTCRGCGAAIRWVSTPGKAHPVDPERLTAWIAPEQHLVAGEPAKKVTLVLEDGQVITGFQASPLVEDAREWFGYTSHFATCPKADLFRKSA